MEITVFPNTVSQISITVIQVYAPNTNAEEAEIEQFYEDQQDLLELTHTHTHTKMSFHYR